MSGTKICPLSISIPGPESIALMPCQEQDCAWWSNGGRCVMADIAQQLTRNKDCLDDIRRGLQDLDTTLDSVEEAVRRI